MGWPSIDHSLLSNTGRMSKRARKAALKREFERLFPKDLFPNGIPIHQLPTQPTDKERLLEQAKQLRELAERGMCVHKYTKEAERLEAQANEVRS